MYTTTVQDTREHRHGFALLSAEEFTARMLADCSWRSFAVDSRTVSAGDVFFALAGEVTDGHNYLAQVIGARARAVVVRDTWFAQHKDILASYVPVQTDGAAAAYTSALNNRQNAHEVSELYVIPVDNCLSLLQNCAQRLLAGSSAVKIGITGSNGKTSTKDMLVSVLSRSHATECTRGNYNSVIGLPLEIARISCEQDSDFIVFEMAMSEKGEIQRLVDIVQPDHALLTNIGNAHIGNIGSTHGIAQEKFAIFSQMGAENIAVIPSDDAHTQNYLDETPKDALPKARIAFYASNAQNSYTLLEETSEGTLFNYLGNSFFVPFWGKAQMHNACGVIRLAGELGISLHDITQGLATARLPRGRGEVLHSVNILIDDSYNANPESMLSALENAQSYAEREHCSLRLILGDMLELGEESGAEHKRILRAALATGARSILLFGSEFRTSYEALSAVYEQSYSQVLSFTRMDEFKYFMQEEYRQNGYPSRFNSPGTYSKDLFLVKASRGMHIERIIPSLPGIHADAHEALQRYHKTQSEADSAAAQQSEARRKTDSEAQRA